MIRRIITQLDTHGSDGSRSQGGLNVVSSSASMKTSLLWWLGFLLSCAAAWAVFVLVFYGIGRMAHWLTGLW
jgi:hypothetical protein